jgi:hypothetical protein
MTTYKTLTAATLALLFLAACGSSGIDDVLGGGSTSGAGRYEIQGTVDSVDLNSRSMVLTNVSGYTSMLSSGGGNTVRVHFDEQTPVDFQGRSYRVADLERGDRIAVRVDESGNALIAESVSVLSDVSGGSSYPSSESTLRGTVRYVDTSRGTIELDRGYGSTTMVEFSTSTPVYFDGRTYRVADLERGDEIEIRVRDLGSGRVAAQDITVTRSISSGSTGSSSSMSTVRGTVRYVDTSRRTIELEQASWVSGFDSGVGGGRTVVVQYGADARVDVSGQLLPITGLERGDVVEIRVQNVGGGTLVADRVWLVRDVRR